MEHFTDQEQMRCCQRYTWLAMWCDHVTTCPYHHHLKISESRSAKGQEAMTDLYDPNALTVTTLEELELSPWQPIETAPTDTEVLVFAPRETVKVFTAKYDADHREWSYSRAGRYAPIDAFYGDELPNLTHWMPLPEPPKLKECAGD